MHPKNVYNQFLTIIEKQTDLSDRAIELALEHFNDHMKLFEEHMELRDFARETIQALSDKKKRNILEESIYQGAVKVLRRNKSD